MVVGEVVEGVVAQVGGEARRDRDGPHRPPLPPHDERRDLAVPAYHTEGIGVD